MLGYLSGGNGSSIRLRDLRGIVRILEWQVHLRQHKAIDVAAQERVSVGGHRDVEATREKAADYRVMVSQVAGPGCRRDSISPIAHRWRNRASHMSWKKRVAAVAIVTAMFSAGVAPAFADAPNGNSGHVGANANQCKNGQDRCCPFGP